MIKYLLPIFFILLMLQAIAQDTTTSTQNGFLQNSEYSTPFVSEIHSTMNKVELGFNKSYSEFDLLEEKTKFDRPMIELHLGFEAPLWAIGYGTKNSTRKWGFGARLPVSVHVLEDMWGPETAPVINTDYRFGGPRLVAIRKIENNIYIKNISFSWLTIFHECTHLGDEIVIYRMNEDFPITRINVSYEYTELQATINDPEQCEGNCHSLRLGFLYRISDRGLGWFSVRDTIEVTNDVTIQASKIKSEFYAQYQWKRTSGFLASKRFVNIISFELRDRLRYGYPIFKKENDVWTTKDVREQMVLNYNLYVGYKMYVNTHTKRNVGLFAHAYRGLNPYGQLRNYPDYPFFGISITYEP